MTTEVVVNETPPVTAAEVIPPQVETVPLAEAAVEIARIEGETQVAIAEINAETEVARSEAIAETVEYNEWQRSIEMQMRELREAQQLILARLTPAELSPPSPESVAVVDLPEAEKSPAEMETEKPKANKRRWI